MKGLICGLLLSGLSISMVQANEMDSVMDALEANDCIQALPKLTKLAQSGNTAAMNQLGSLFLVGQCVEIDREMAKEWYEQSAAAGSKRAEMMLNNFKG